MPSKTSLKGAPGTAAQLSCGEIQSLKNNTAEQNASSFVQLVLKCSEPMSFLINYSLLLELLLRRSCGPRLFQSIVGHEIGKGDRTYSPSKLETCAYGATACTGAVIKDT